MNHELCNVRLSLITLGYKVDGHGIKDYCDLNNYKSVDYIYNDNTSFFLIEFSDLYRQQNEIANIIEETKSSNLNRKVKTNIIKQQHKIIHRELVTKYKDTCYILREINKCISSIPNELKECGQKYLIIISPLDPSLPKERKIDLVRYMDDLKDKVANAIPDNIFGGVELISINKFVKII